MRPAATYVKYARTIKVTQWFGQLGIWRIVVFTSAAHEPATISFVTFCHKKFGRPCIRCITILRPPKLLLTKVFHFLVLFQLCLIPTRFLTKRTSYSCHPFPIWLAVSTFTCDVKYTVANNTALFEMTVGVLTTCHTQYTLDNST